jgi:hypothetical protein
MTFLLRPSDQFAWCRIRKGIEDCGNPRLSFVSVDVLKIHHNYARVRGGSCGTKASALQG